MDLTVDEIINAPFRWFEKEKDKRSLSGYHVYLMNAYDLYKISSEEKKMGYLRRAIEPAVRRRLTENGFFVGLDEDPFEIMNASDFSHSDVQRTVNYHWNIAEESWKSAWRCRAKKLNGRPSPGLFKDLPEELLSVGEDRVDSDELIRHSLKADSRNLFQWFKKHIRKEENCASVRGTIFRTPRAVKVGSRIYIKPVVLPELLKTLILSRAKVSRENEMYSVGRNGGIFHVHSARRMNEIFTLSGDLFLTQIENFKENEKYCLSSYMVVKMANGSRSFKAFGWDETKETLLVKFTNGQIVEFLRPQLTTNENGEKRTDYNCTQSLSINGALKYVITEYYPAVINLNRETNVLKVLAARLCVKADGTLNKSKCS